MVAFKDSSKAAAPAPDPHEELIKSYLGSGSGEPGSGGPGSGGTISLTAVAAGSSAGSLPGGAVRLQSQRSDGAQRAQQAQQQELAQLMSRRALVAAAALSGRTSSGLADMLAAYSPTAETAAGAAGAGPLNDSAQQQQQQQVASGASGEQLTCSARPALPSGAQNSLAAPPSAYSRASSGASSAQEDSALLQGRGSASGGKPGGSDENV